jgi:hypothetical protein
VSDPFDRVLDELDHHEMHIRRLARRIDKGSVPYDRIELSLSRKMQSALDFLHEESELREGDKPNPAMVAVARAKTQAMAICDLARELQSFGVTMDLEEIERQLERDREAMNHRLEIWIGDAPDEVEPITVAKDYYDLIFNPQQELLLRLDYAMDEVERRAKSD